MDRVLKDTQAVIKLEIRDATGTLVNADLGPVTAKIVDSAGVEISGSPFTATHPPAVTGIYEITLNPTRTAQMDIYEAEWSATVGGGAHKFRTRYEVVGGFICTVQEIRDADERLANTTKYPIAKVVAARERAEELIESHMGISWRPRARRETLSGHGRSRLRLAQYEISKLVSGSVDGVALTATQIANISVHSEGILEWEDGSDWTVGIGNLVVFYEHGMKEAPEHIRQATAELAASYLIPDPTPQRTDSVDSDVGSLRFGVAARSTPTGIPEVDAIINDSPYELPIG